MMLSNKTTHRSGHLITANAGYSCTLLTSSKIWLVASARSPVRKTCKKIWPESRIKSSAAFWEKLCNNHHSHSLSRFSESELNSSLGGTRIYLKILVSHRIYPKWPQKHYLGARNYHTHINILTPTITLFYRDSIDEVEALCILYK